MSNLPFLDDQHELERYSTIVQQWIASVLEEEPHGTLQEYLSDGAVLCRLANKKRPGSIPRFHNKANVKALQLENIGKFINVMLRLHGFSRVQLFQNEDIDRGNMKGVVAVLLEYRQKTAFPVAKRKLSSGTPTDLAPPERPSIVIDGTAKPTPTPTATSTPALTTTLPSHVIAAATAPSKIVGTTTHSVSPTDLEQEIITSTPNKFKNSYHVMNAIFSSEAYKALLENTTGTVITPNDPMYEISRCMHNRLYNALPYLIIQPSCPQDVVLAIDFAKAHDWKISVKSGGFSTSGFCVAEDTLLLDMCRMNHIHVNADLKSGARWIDVLQATFPSIVVGPYDSSLGMGVILGGGFGPLINSHGLASDRVVSLEVVLETGEIIRCDHTNNEDMFYALRGGGGLSFVTSITLEMVYDVPYYISTTRQAWPLDQAKAILSHQAKVVLDFTDRNLALITQLVRGKIKIESLYYGDQSRSMKVKDILLPPQLPETKDKGKITTYLQWCKEHCSVDRTNKYIVRSYLFENLDEDLINTLLQMSTSYPDGGECEITVEWLYGALSDVTTLSAQARLVYCCYFRHNDSQWTSWVASCDSYFLNKCSGVCPNYTNSDLPRKDFPRLYWGDNYTDLQAHKVTYDPHNFFSYPQSVEPSSL